MRAESQLIDRQLRRGPVSLTICEDAGALERAHAPVASGLRYGRELRELSAPRGDPERFITRGVLAVALATIQGGPRQRRRLVGWGELLVGRPTPGELATARGYCRVSRLDVAPSHRRRIFVDAASGLPVSELLLAALVGAAPFGAEVVAEVTPDAENLFETAGFRVFGPGRWRLIH